MTRTHIVRPGECLSSIAWLYGFCNYKSLYEHPDNAELRKRRPNPDVIHPGDVVVIPERKMREVEIATARVHTFRLKRPRRLLRIRLVGDDGEPLRHAPYELRAGDVVRKGKTNGEGTLEENVPRGAEVAVIETETDIWQLALGDLNPMDDVADEGISGAQARLANLGYAVGPVDGIFGPRTRAAVQAFQNEQGLEPTARLDDDTKRTLRRLHGS